MSAMRPSCPRWSVWLLIAAFGLLPATLASAASPAAEASPLSLSAAWQGWFEGVVSWLGSWIPDSARGLQSSPDPREGAALSARPEAVDGLDTSLPGGDSPLLPPRGGTMDPDG